jgi:hypothetical protein
MNDIDEAQYRNLRTGFKILVETILGSGYYNMAADVYNSDLMCCSDIIDEYNRKIFKQVKNPFNKEDL